MSAFLNSSFPESTKKKNISLKTVWRGLNMFDRSGGYVSKGINFRITPSGSIRAAEKPETVFDEISGFNPITLFGDESLLIYVYANDNGTLISFIDTENGGEIQTVALKDEKDFAPRSIARFNVWTGNSDIINGSYIQKYLIYPDKKVIVREKDGTLTMDDISLYNIIETETVYTKVTVKVYSSWSVDENGEYTLTTQKGKTKTDRDTKETTRIYSVTENNSEDNLPQDHTEPKQKDTIYVRNSDGTLTETKTEVSYSYSYSYDEKYDAVLPDAEYITVFGTRVFGINGTKIFASENGSYASYNLDTSNDFDENNAWYCATQDGGDFYAITSYGDRVTAFKHGKMYELYNTKNPFRIKEVGNVGVVGAFSVSQTANKLFFTSENGVYYYTGSYPKSISENVIDKSIFYDGKFNLGVSGAWDGKYYVYDLLDDSKKAQFEYSSNPTFFYDTSLGCWSALEIDPSQEIACFASNKSGIYAVTLNGIIYKLNSGEYRNTYWAFETSFDTENTADVKELVKIQAIIRFHTAGGIKISAKYDNGEYTALGEMRQRTEGIYALNCPISKSDHVARKLKFECEGDIEIMSLEQIFKTGGKRNV